MFFIVDSNSAESTTPGVNLNPSELKNCNKYGKFPHGELCPHSKKECPIISPFTHDGGNCV